MLQAAAAISESRRRDRAHGVDDDGPGAPLRHARARARRRDPHDRARLLLHHEALRLRAAATRASIKRVRCTTTLQPCRRTASSPPRGRREAADEGRGVDLGALEHGREAAGPRDRGRGRRARRGARQGQDPPLRRRVHGLGVEPEQLPDLGCDFVVSGCHKWLFGPRGTGIVWGRAEAWAEVSPTIPSFGDVESFVAWLEGSDPGSPTSASAFAPGGYHAFEHRWALAAAFAFRQEIGHERAAEWTHGLARRLKEGLRESPGTTLRTPPDERLSAGLVCCDEPGESAVERLRDEHGVVASLTPTRRATSASARARQLRTGGRPSRGGSRGDRERAQVTLCYLGSSGLPGGRSSSSRGGRGPAPRAPGARLRVLELRVREAAEVWDEEHDRGDARPRDLRGVVERAARQPVRLPGHLGDSLVREPDQRLVEEIGSMRQMRSTSTRRPPRRRSARGLLGLGQHRGELRAVEVNAGRGARGRLDDRGHNPGLRHAAPMVQTAPSPVRAAMPRISSASLAAAASASRRLSRASSPHGPPGRGR